MKTFVLSLWLLISCCCLGQKDISGLSYGASSQEVFDLFLPKDLNPQTPLVIFVHGGAWSLGDRFFTDSHARKLRDKGFVVANIDYRYVSETLSGEDLEQDVSRAITKVRDLGKEYGFASSVYHLVGISAGAHLALMHAYKNTALVRSVTSICGPVRLDTPEILDFIAAHGLLPVIELLAGSKYEGGQPNARFTAISPYSLANKVPTLLIHGTADPLVPYQQATFMASVLSEKKMKSKLIPIEGANHAAGMDQPESENKNLEEIAAWIKNSGNQP